MKARSIVIVTLALLCFTGGNLEPQTQNGKIATWLPALIWNPLHFPSGDSLHQTLFRAGYQSILTDNLALYIDSLSNYHFFILAGIYEHGEWPTIMEPDIFPYLQEILAFLSNRGSIYWEGAVSIGSLGPMCDSLKYYFEGEGMAPPIPVDYLYGCDGTLFGNIDSLGYQSDGAELAWLAGDPRFVTYVFGSGSYCGSLALLASMAQSHTMLANFSWARVRDGNNSTRIDLVNDIMAWLSGTVGIDEPKPGNIPNEFSISQNYPNPFNARTTIQFALPKEGKVKLEIFDILGKRVTTLIEGIIPAGYHNAVWDAANQPSGVYFYRIEALGQNKSGRMTLIK